MSDGEQGGDHDAEAGDTTKELQIMRTQTFCLIPRQLPRAKWGNTTATLEFTDETLAGLGGNQGGVVAVRQWVEGGYGQGVRMVTQDITHGEARRLGENFVLFDMDPSPSMGYGAVLKNGMAAMPMLLEWCIMAAHAQGPVRAALCSGTEALESAMDGCYAILSGQRAEDLVPAFQAAKAAGHTFKRFSWTVATDSRAAVLRVANSTGKAFAPWRRVELTKAIDVFITGFEPVEYADTGIATQWLRELLAGFQGFEPRRNGARATPLAW